MHAAAIASIGGGTRGCTAADLTHKNSPGKRLDSR